MQHKHLDIYLLRCLRALVEEAHVTKAARRVGATQPAMSVVLRRLRETFNDPLLVRTEAGMVVTPRARELVASLGPAVEAIDDALAAERPFDPAEARMTLNIGASESISFVFLARIITRLRELAPHIQVAVHIPDLQRVRQDLEEGRADLLLSFTRSAPEDLRSYGLWKQKLVVILSGAHPLPPGVLTLEDYLVWPHACHRIGMAGSSIEEAIEVELGKLGRGRVIGAWLPSAISLPPLVAHGDFLATVPERVAHYFAPALSLRTLPPPLDLPDVQIRMYWHDRMHRSPVHQWLRRVIRDVAGA